VSRKHGGPDTAAVSVLIVAFWTGFPIRNGKLPQTHAAKSTGRSARHMALCVASLPQQRGVQTERAASIQRRPSIFLIPSVQLQFLAPSTIRRTACTCLSTPGRRHGAARLSAFACRLTVHGCCTTHYTGCTVHLPHAGRAGNLQYAGLAIEGLTWIVCTGSAIGTAKALQRYAAIPSIYSMSIDSTP
jgi:hypothetical protein